MKKFAFAIAALVGIGFLAAPVQQAQAETVKKVIIKKDRGHHDGWRRERHRHGWNHRRGATKVIIKKRRYD
jgi:Ni/Co efflux regulator RcnB